MSASTSSSRPGARCKREYGVRTLDVAKRLLDYGIHPPTVYFPLIVDEALMVEPTETESLATLDRFVEVMRAIAAEAAATRSCSTVRPTPRRCGGSTRRGPSSSPTLPACPHPLPAEEPGA